MQKKISKWNKVLTVALVLLTMFAFTACSVGGLLSSRTSQTTIDGTYKLSVGDQSVQVSDSDVAEKVAYQMMIATVELNCTDASYSTGSGGTGFIVSEDGYVVTNAHVITYTKSSGSYFNPVTRTYVYSTIKANFYSDRSSRFTMEVVAYDTALDLAVLKFRELPEGGFDRIVTFADSDALNYGQVVVAIGNANGYGLAVTSGVVSVPLQVFDNGDGTTTSAIQTDAAINPGNSGGPLFNKRAEVIGVNSFKLVTENTENMGYAIPSNVVKEYLDTVNASKGLSIRYQTAA